MAEPEDWSDWKRQRTALEAQIEALKGEAKTLRSTNGRQMKKIYSLGLERTEALTALKQAKGGGWLLAAAMCAVGAAAGFLAGYLMAGGQM